MINAEKTKEELLLELQQLKEENEMLKKQYQNDIAERELIEAKNNLEESNNRLQSIFLASPIGIGVVKDRVFLEVNSILLQITGYTKEELIGKSSSIIYPSQMEFDYVGKEKYRQMEETGIGVVETKWKTKDGTIIDILLSSTRIKLGVYKNCTTFTALDITARKQAEESLKESEEHYRNFVEFLPDGVYKSTKSGKFIEVNTALVNMLGYDSKEELMAIDINKDLYPDPNERDVLILKDRIGKLDIYQLKRKDGSFIWVEDNGWYVEDDNGEIIFHEGIIRDVTERKRTEDLLAASEEKHRSLIEQMQEGLLVVDHDDVIQFANPMFCEMLGYEFSELIGKVGNRLLLNEHDRERIIKKNKNRKTGIIEQYELNMLKKSGEQITLLMNASPRKDKTGAYIGSMSTCIDITERKKVEKDLIEAKEKAEESDKLKSAFLANMSHEIRTPMNGILGFAQLLKEPNLTREEYKEYISMIDKSGVRMINIINDIIDISKIEAGLMNVSLFKTNINEQIDFIYSFFKPEVEARGMSLAISKDVPADALFIITDSEKLYAILTNLVKNAIKYSEKGLIEIGYIIKDDFIKFFVKDQGIGIPKNRQEAIFERFTQADIADKMARHGAGLGLSISKAYIEMLGGDIWVESEEGVGSTFYFVLPNTISPGFNNQSYDVVHTNDSIEQIKKLKVLIVEDDTTSEKLIAITINKFCKEIIKCKNGIDAVEICRNNPDIDLILMDIKMPLMNGLEATEKIREFNNNVVIIAQTAYGLSSDREKALESGCNDYISKPINKAKLIELFQIYFKF